MYKSNSGTPKRSRRRRPSGKAPNGIHYAMWGETRIPESDLERLVGAVPAAMSAALASRAYYFVPLAIADTGETMIAPVYSVDLGDRAVCHRNAVFGSHGGRLSLHAAGGGPLRPGLRVLHQRGAQLC